MLRAALNKSWKNRLTNKELYGKIPLVSNSIKQQQIRFAGHCWRSKEELAGDVLLWTPMHGRRTSGSPKKTYIDQLIMDDTGCLFFLITLHKRPMD